MRKISDHNSFLILLAFYFFLATFLLDRYQRVWVDEPWESITASTLIHEGKLYNPVLENYSGFDKILLQPRLFINGALAPVFALFGVGHMQGRLASVVCGALLLLAVYLLTKDSFSKRISLLATWFTAIETMLFISYRTIRPEIYLVTLETFSLMFFLKGVRSNSGKFFFWSGLFAGIGLWTHPNGILHVGAILALLLAAYKGKAFTSKNSWVFAAAGIIAVIPYVAYVVFNDAQNSFATFYLQLDNRTSALASQNWFVTSFRGEWNRIVEITQFPYRLPAVLIFIGVWFLSVRSKDTATRYIALAVGVHALLSFLMIANKTVVYASSILPMLCILSAVAVDRELGDSFSVTQVMKNAFDAQHLRQSLAILIILVFTVNQLAGDARLLWRNKDCSYSETVQRLQSVIPGNAKLWGSITFWFAFQHQPMRSQYTYLREVEAFKPEYMITGDAEVWGKEFWKPVREKADSLIGQRGSLVATLPENCYGHLRVYRMKW